jgi:hypothetical protein
MCINVYRINIIKLQYYAILYVVILLTECAEFLLQHRAEVQLFGPDASLLLAIRMDNFPLLAALLDWVDPWTGVDAQKDMLDRPDGFSPLYRAIERGTV